MSGGGKKKKKDPSHYNRDGSATELKAQGLSDVCKQGPDPGAAVGSRGATAAQVPGSPAPIPALTRAECLGARRCGRARAGAPGPTGDPWRGGGLRSSRHLRPPSAHGPCQTRRPVLPVFPVPGFLAPLRRVRANGNDTARMPNCACSELQ